MTVCTCLVIPGPIEMAFCLKSVCACGQTRTMRRVVGGLLWLCACWGSCLLSPGRLHSAPQEENASWFSDLTLPSWPELPGSWIPYFCCVHLY